MKTVLQDMATYISDKEPQPHDFHHEYDCGYHDATSNWLEALQASQFECTKATEDKIVALIENQKYFGGLTGQSSPFVLDTIIKLIRSGTYKI